MTDMKHTPTPDADVLIVGAGPAGLALASALSDAGLTALLLEQQPRSALEKPADDGREIALTHRARDVMRSLGMWDRVPTDRISPLRQAHVLNGDAPGLLRFAATGEESLGWLIANQQIRQAAFDAALARPGVQLQCEARVTGLDLRGPLGRVTLADGRCLSAPLVVAADSRLSQTRRLAGIGASMHDFGRSVVMGPVAHERDHDGVALECFRYGNTLALLPMRGQQSSAVVTVAADRAAEWMGLDDADFARRIEAQSGARLGAMRSVGPRHVYPLVGVYAHRFVAARFALIGDAAVGMHPVTAHGYNFGLYGVETLVGSLKAAYGKGQDIGALATLQTYESVHRRTTLPVYLGTNAVVSLFTDERAPARLARRAVLDIAEHAPGLSRLIKGAITRQLTGGPTRTLSPR